MGDCMAFPATFDEFAEKYKIVDSKEIYTNGTELIPIFRVKQWLEHQEMLKGAKNPPAIDCDYYRPSDRKCTYGDEEDWCVEGPCERCKK